MGQRRRDDLQRIVQILLELQRARHRRAEHLGQPPIIAAVDTDNGQQRGDGAGKFRVGGAGVPLNRAP